MFTAATEGSVILNVPRNIGSYSLTHIIGRGQSSVVFAATNTCTGAEFAIKVLSYSSFAHTNQVRRLNRELQVLRELDHPNICKCHETFQDGDLVFIVMEKCGGEDLLMWLCRRKERSKADYLRIFVDIAEGLAHVHKAGWSHSDIKLENVVIDAEGRAKLIDFGFAKHTRLAGDDEKNGTVLYSAPELFRSGAFSPQKADLWSMGIVLFALATGTFPFPTTDERRVPQFAKKGRLCFPKVMDASVESLIRRMTALNPNERPTVDDVLQDPAFAQFGPTEKPSWRLPQVSDMEAAFFMC
jgi:serine/threonine protein kinase